MEILYQYLTGVQFCQRIEAIVEAFLSIEKKWASQEMQIKKNLTH
jgi:hypothetical protein